MHLCLRDHPLLAHITLRFGAAIWLANTVTSTTTSPSQSPRTRCSPGWDKLAELGTSVITISGGEPLLHPELDEIIRRIRKRGMIAGLITNGYLLVAERIQRLNRAGLEWLQISIDNVTPDDVSKKSLKVLDKKLELLAEHADFHVNINSVVGGGVCNPQDALTIAARRALELQGFSSTVGIIHDGGGTTAAARGRRREERLPRDEGDGEEQFHPHQLVSFQDNIAQGRPNQWRCKSGAPVTYISAKTAWCTVARNSAAILRFLYRTTPSRTFAASTSPKNPAPPLHRLLCCIRSHRSSIPGVPQHAAQHAASE